jgi:ferredoxin
MADKTRILKENVPGKWYVDDSCTPCHVCLEEAPKLLKYNEDQTYVYFFKQPETPEELDAAQRALEQVRQPAAAVGHVVARRLRGGGGGCGGGGGGGGG